MKKHFVERIIERQKKNCKHDCAKFIENNVGKYEIDDLEERLCSYCNKSIAGTKRIWHFLGHHPNI